MLERCTAVYTGYIGIVRCRAQPGMTRVDETWGVWCPDPGTEDSGAKDLKSQVLGRLRQVSGITQPTRSDSLVGGQR